MVSDTEPRYRLVDSNGNVVGSLYAEADGTLKLQEGTSGSDNEVSVATDGTVSAPALSTESIDITPVFDVTSNFSGGQTKNFGSIPLGTAIYPTAVPNNDPDNDHGYEVSYRFSDANSAIQISVTETENAGGGEARVVAWELSV